MASPTREDGATILARLARVAEPLAGGAITLLGAWFLWQSLELREGPGYAAVGPRVFPVIVGLGFVASGLAVLVSGLRRAAATASGAPAGHLAEADEPVGEGEAREPTDWRTLVAMAVLLAAYLVVYLPLGFILASALFFVAGSWTLGSRSPARDVVAGALVSLVAYVVFTRLLGLELPAGPLEGPLRTLQALDGRAV